METVLGDPKLADYLEDVLATIRHQLGNSVNALKITLEVMQDNFDRFDENKRKEYLRRASELTARQTGMIEAMRSYSSVNANDPKLLDFRAYWERFLNNARGRAEGQNIRLNHRLDLGSLAPTLIMANPIALNTAVQHLFDNALEALELIENPTLDLVVVRREDEILITIQDNGCGIRNGDLPFVFTPLFTTKPGRRGMGLPIALKLISKMGGRIEVKSISGKGTQVNAWLRTNKGEGDGQTVQV